MRFVFFICLFVLLGVTQGHAQTPQAYLAMHGDAKYADHFDHLSYVNPSAPKGGMLTEIVTGSFDSFHPYLLKGQPAAGLKYVHDSLMRRVWDEPFSLYPLIAKAVVVPDDRSQITFLLDKRARFHDKAPITSADVAFTFDALKAHGRPNMRRIYGLVSKVQINGPHSITFFLGPGHDRETVMILAMMPVLPAHDWKDRDFAATTLEMPLGSGPYQIDGFELGRYVSYKRVKGYWAKDLPVNRGLYNFDGLRFDYVRDDAVAREAFLKGDADIRFEYDLSAWNEAYDDARLAAQSIVKEQVPHNRPGWFHGFVFNTRRAPFDDPKLRQALADVFDYKWLNKTLFYGQKTQGYSSFSNSELAGVDKPKQRPNLRARLKALQSVLQDKQLQGTLSFSILLQDRSHEKMALHYAAALKRVGVTVTVRNVDSAQFQRLTGEFDFDLAYGRFINSLSPGTEQAVYWGCSAAALKGGRNLAGLCDQDLDESIAAITLAKDYAGLVAATQDMDRRLMRLTPMVPFGYDGVDRLLRRGDIQRPEIVPVYGVVKEAFW